MCFLVFFPSLRPHSNKHTERANVYRDFIKYHMTTNKQIMTITSPPVSVNVLECKCSNVFTELKCMMFPSYAAVYSTPSVMS